MDEPQRYQRDFDLLMQEAQANDILQRNKTRQFVRDSLDKSIRGVCVAHKFTDSQSHAYRERLLSDIFADLGI